LTRKAIPAHPGESTTPKDQDLGMRELAVVIPAHNEEQVIGRTLETLTALVSPADVYVISDASTDRTVSIARSFQVNCIDQKQNRGKTKSLETVIAEYEILDRYQFVSILDADTLPTKHYFERLLQRFTAPDIACVCGYVQSEPAPGLFVAYRSTMYFIWQHIHKRLSSLVNAVAIAPGTASMYRTAVLKHIEFDSSLIIEDFDMTFQVHRKRLGKIAFEPRAKVITQDPDDLGDTFKQITRWQLGLLQTAFKHGVPFGRQPFDLLLLVLLLVEVVHILALFVLMPLAIWIVFFALYPSIFGRYVQREVFLSIGLLEIGLLWGLSIIDALLARKPAQLLHGPFLWLVQYIYVLAFFWSLYQALFRSIHGTWASPARRASHSPLSRQRARLKGDPVGVSLTEE
jgi:cellulose synthase/poly-beta-1,6-N-acetylglucosamine synthase-like glycosyltransferase